MNEITTEPTNSQLPVKEERSVLLTKRASRRIGFLGIYASLLTCVAGGIFCIFGPWPCSVLLIWFTSIPLEELTIGFILLFLLSRKVLFGIKTDFYSNIYNDRPFEQVPEVIAYYPRTFQEVIRVFFIFVDTYILGFTAGYLVPIAMLHAIFSMGYAFRK